MITIVNDCRQDMWDEYIGNNPRSLFFHRHGWAEALAVTYDLPVFRLAARNNAGTIVGALPVILFSPPGAAKRLLSLPYTDAAGIVAENGEAASELVSAALRMAQELGADHLEIRQAGNAEQEAFSPGTAPWHHMAHAFKTGLSRTLPVSPEALWLDLRPKVRNQVRKAMREGCRAEIGGRELLPDFFAVFSENMRDLGSPVHDPAIFRHLAGHFPESMHVVVVFRADLPVAAAILLRHGATLFNPWASSLRRERPFCPNMLLYFTMLDFAVQTQCERFDFGRSSPHAPTCRFKLQWGAVMQPLVWHVYSRPGCHWHPERESLAHENWKSVSLAESNRRGPALRRWISL
ncbi:GNAT family N-acetyltransferase [Geobacter sp. FeAm09]|uniref:GNAT family N-acetyltransferase n=1 Tax=Geobacter sp. FeAm09 TaxID=2597769 RepID=UPI0011EE5107|nr:GNAT family N-acetyltransferase [Geobacter sp. FeAm09]QEM68785.1 GNAT family N-acetyltransferase [Geobacter sp. FeAm09]